MLFNSRKKKKTLNHEYNLKSAKALTFKQATSLLMLRSGIRDLGIFAEHNIF